MKAYGDSVEAVGDSDAMRIASNFKSTNGDMVNATTDIEGLRKLKEMFKDSGEAWQELVKSTPSLQELDSVNNALLALAAHNDSITNLEELTAMYNSLPEEDRSLLFGVNFGDYTSN